MVYETEMNASNAAFKNKYCLTIDYRFYKIDEQKPFQF